MNPMNPQAVIKTAISKLGRFVNFIKLNQVPCS